MRDQLDQVRLKNFNRRSVLNYIRKHQTATKAGLASVTGLTFMAIKKILEELEELGLIRCEESDPKKPGGVGRRAVSYALNEGCRYTLGVHINKFVTSVGLMDLSGNVLYKRRRPMQQDLESQSSFVEQVLEDVAAVIAQAGADRGKILGIGVGVPGPVDTESGTVLTPPNIPVLRYLPLKEILEQRTGLPVYVQKDTNVIAFGEYWCGPSEDVCDLTYIDVDMGIGSGMVIGGMINEGANGMAGEFGHITIDPDGPLCNCGNRGCLEAMSSGIAVLREMERQLEQNASHPLYERRRELALEDIFCMVEKKDLLTISILNRSAFYMGVAVSNLINILDPQIIILGGILIQRYPRYFSIVKDVAASRRLKGARETRMELSLLGENAGMVGAGEVVADHFFNEMVNEVFSKNGS